MIQSQTLNDTDIFTIMLNRENIKSFLNSMLNFFLFSIIPGHYPHRLTTLPCKRSQPGELEPVGPHHV